MKNDQRIEQEANKVKSQYFPECPEDCDCPWCSIEKDFVALILSERRKVWADTINTVLSAKVMYGESGIISLDSHDILQQIAEALKRRKENEAI